MAIDRIGELPANIEARASGALQWETADAARSLQSLFSDMEAHAVRASNWYWANKTWKARLSRWVRLWSLILTALAALLPIVLYIARDLQWVTEKATASSGLWASGLVGLAAALLGIDRAFGFSTGWARYVLAGTEIRKQLGEFRLDWLAQQAAMGPNPTPEQLMTCIHRAKDFSLAVERVIAQETREWVTEFQTNLARLESDVKGQVDALKARAAAHARGG